MGDDEQFTEWLEDSNKDAEFRSAVRLLLEKYNKAIEVIDEALGEEIRLRNLGELKNTSIFNVLHNGLKGLQDK